MVNGIDLSREEKAEINRLLKLCSRDIPSLQEMWMLTDIVWDEMGCDNKELNWNRIEQFYSHPVWLLNGFFIEQHGISMQHRHAISNWVVGHQSEIRNVLDYGGGFGTLAILIAEKDADIEIDIFDPYPTEYAVVRLRQYNNIRFISTLSSVCDKKYDCLISTDVLEHVPDPLNTFGQMIGAVTLNGYVIVANNFRPVTKCHLPSSFHLRYTFDKFPQMMGLNILGPCHGSHAMIYQRTKVIPFDWRKIRFCEQVSRMLFPFFKTGHFVLRRLRKVILEP